MKPQVAVIGGGAAGISAACGLCEDAQVTLFESEPRLGGHAHTVEVEDAGRTFGLDTAFIVYNEPHYPKITRFFADLGVATQSHPGKFCFFDLDAGSAYVSDDFEQPEEEVRARYPDEFVRLWQEARRFLEESPRHFIRKQADIPLGEYLDRNGYSEEFRYGFIVLISTAAWSVPADRIWDMPASTVIAFFFAHGAEGLGGRTAPWRTVTGGSVSYVRAAAARLRAARARIRPATPVVGVRQEPDGVVVRTAAGAERFDYAVLATHADDSMRMLENPTPRQRMLEAFAYHPTRATLHTDTSVMPDDRAAWRSWNYGRRNQDGRQVSWVNYYLNDLQCLEGTRDYFLTLDSGVDIRDEHVIEEISYRHPVFTMEARRLQSEIYSLNDPAGRLMFAGSYFHSRKLGPDVIGLHESAFDSGLAAAEAIREALHRSRDAAA
ncbi:MULTISPECIES: NAD(P)/FAD-dependent oxidoreductase [Streptomyces]|jgi:predicted NAD/FAD-binding protein|uniref:Predicted NAD/FAD-binding protein n=1 Tax=Streptomyces radiopugnans TaxID=403935 RepID=A0A1H9F667_9ACTN|nr:FAD-dependent oxidoreductase [Streptomyces radiopugnans]SEQ33432.1 Predicted NAD/FAD-binding protein [Streptomyces radiopugnans]